MTHRVYLLAGVMVLLMVGFALRLFELQVIEGEHLAQAVDQSRLVTEILPPRRGRILDRNGTPITDNRAVYHLAVVLADLELSGRARRDVPVYRFDEQRLDALTADLAVRQPRPPAELRDILLNELLTHPAVAQRTGARKRDADLALVTVPRRALAPSGADTDADTQRLVESDLLVDDPREALARELTLRWKQPVEVCTEEELRAAAQRLDEDFAGGSDEHALAVLDPFLRAYPLHLDVPGHAPVDVALRLIEADRRVQAEAVLAQLLGEVPQLVHEHLDRALAAARKPLPDLGVYFAPSARAEAIAPLLPAGQELPEIRLGAVPGVRERVLLVQGDPPDGDGLFSQLTRHLAASLGVDGEWLGALLEKHGERLRPVVCERDYGLHQIILDPVRVERLALGLSSQLTALGRPTTRLDIEQALAAARAVADRAWDGQTHVDPIALISDLPHALIVRLAGHNCAPPADLAKAFEDADSPLPGLSIQVDLGREYPFPGAASHLIGTVARGRDPEQRSGPITWQGRSGLEGHYDSVLRGVSGLQVRLRTPDGASVVRDEAPVAGTDLVTELDMELQVLAEDSLTHWYDLAKALGTTTEAMASSVDHDYGKGVAGFALIDCHTGAILALASTPGYRLEDLRTRYHELDQTRGKPLLDYATMPDQMPGSVMKICTALACLEYGVLTPGEIIFCGDAMGHTPKGEKILSEHGGAVGDCDLPTAIQRSSNVYFATIARRLGGERLAAFASQLGLGRNNALDVSDQRPGFLPKPSTIAHDRPLEPHWAPNDDWRFGIGQFPTTAPIQVVVLAAAVANGGHIVRPYLVAPAGPPEVVDLHIRKDYLAEVRHGMEMVTANLPHSTAKSLVLEGAAAGCKVAAKTGTSERGSPETRRNGTTPDNAWMIGYAPADNPTVAFACFIHSGTFGGQACTPVVKRILERYFAKYGRGGHAVRQAPAE